LFSIRVMSLPPRLLMKREEVGIRSHSMIFLQMLPPYNAVKHPPYNAVKHPCNKSPSAIAVPRAAAIAGVRTYESVPLYALPL